MAKYVVVPVPRTLRYNAILIIFQTYPPEKQETVSPPGGPPPSKEAPPSYDATSPAPTYTGHVPVVGEELGNVDEATPGMKNSLACENPHNTNS
jgi:hypothetical protein